MIHDKGFILIIVGGSLIFKSINPPTPSTQTQQWKIIKNIKDLENIQGDAIVDFTAKWCVSCKEMESYTFTDARVKSALGNAVLLQADVTANDDLDQALLKHFGLFGPPGIIFYNSTSPNEQKNYRVVGYMEAEDFANNITKAFK